MKTVNNKSKIISEKNYDNTKISKKQIKKDHIEIGGPKGKEPTRFGDWEKNGRCSDF